MYVYMLTHHMSSKKRKIERTCHGKIVTLKVNIRNDPISLRNVLVQPVWNGKHQPNLESVWLEAPSAGKVYVALVMLL